MYFNHSFKKTFLGTKNNALSSTNNVNQSYGDNSLGAQNSGFIKGPGTYQTVNLIDGTAGGSNLGIGSYGFFDPKTWTSVGINNSPAVTPCCPLVLAASAIYQKDQIGALFTGGGTSGGFHGGYQESNKSKVINPKYISKFYRVDPCVPNQNVVHVGETPYTAAHSPAVSCNFTFLCDQSYSLRLDIKGSPTLRFLDHNAYYETAKWTGCCPAGCLAPVAVDPTTVYIAWATQLLNSPLINPFIQIIVYDQHQNPVGLANDTVAWAAYVAQTVTGTDAGMTIVGAYVDTMFGNCTFYPTDFFEKEPVHIYASMVDYTGSVCDFTGVCVKESCCPRQGNGFGDTVLKDLILSERYQQNDFYTGNDLRIREITQGYDVTNAVNRSVFYTRYYIAHNVPRFNNPTGVFDNDQYLLEIITNGIDVNLENFMATWLNGCGPCPELEIYSCGTCCPKPLVIPKAVGGTSYVVTNPGGYTIATTGGQGTITFTGGTFQSSLVLNTNGTITGTPTVGGTYTVTTTATDAHGLVVGCFDVEVFVTT